MPPVELTSDSWDEIIDILGAELEPNKLSLENLSLTCKAMVPLCRRHLFSIIYLIDKDNSPDLIGRFHNLVSHNPSIIHFVRHLSHRIYSPDDVRVHQVFGILAKSTTLRYICLFQWPERSQDWTTISRPLQTALERLIRLPTVTELDLAGIYSIPSSIFLGSNITSIALKFVNFIDTHDLDVDIASHVVSPLKPTRLQVNDGSFRGLRVLMKSKQIVDFSGLRRARFCIDEKRDMKVMYKLIRLSGVIQYVDILIRWGYIEDHGPPSWDGFGALLSTSVGTLKGLSFGLFVLSEDDEPLGKLVSQLDMAAKTNVLEQLFLNITFDDEVSCRADTGDWAAFDSLMTRPGSFPVLKLVKVNIFWHASPAPVRCRPRTTDQIMNQITERTFPKLLASTALRFHFSAVIKPAFM